MPVYAQSLSLQLTRSNYNGYNVSCFGGRDGAIDLTITGGYPPYNITWSNAATTEDITTLASGYYRVEVLDDSSNFASAEVTLTEPEAINITLTASIFTVNSREYNISLAGACNGSLNAAVTGGVTPYTYYWNPSGATSAVISNLCAVEYKVIVTDHNGCTNYVVKLMTEPPRDDWTMSGNTGSDPNNDFIGTSDQTDFVFKTNNEERIRLKADGEINIASFAGDSDAILISDEYGNVSRWSISMPQLPVCPDPQTFAWHHKLSVPEAVYTCWDRVGVNTNFPRENLQIGDQFTFHSGGSKVISFNSYYDVVAEKRKRIESAPVSVLHFHENGAIEFQNTSDNGTAEEELENILISRLRITPAGFIGINCNDPKEGLQIGDRWTFHNGGSKTIAYNSYYDHPDSKRLVDGYAQSIGFDSDGNINLKTSAYGSAGSTITYFDGLLIDSQGNVSIGTWSVPDNSYKLSVCGNIRCKKVKVEAGSWCDYVFKDDYPLPSLKELEEFIKQNQHLPGFPKENDILSNGLDLGDMTVLQQKSIEEIFLYLIELKNENNELRIRIEKMEGGLK